MLPFHNIIAMIFILISKSICTRVVHNKVVENRNNLDINCYKIMGHTAGTYHIEIHSAIWWKTEGELSTPCDYEKDKTDEVKQQCDNKYKCNMEMKSVNDKSFMKIVIDFECHVGNCPHKTFEAKHVDAENQSPIVFVQIAEARRIAEDWEETSLTTIYTKATGRQYIRHPNYDEICLFTLPSETYDCMKHDGTWSCYKKTPEVGEHDTVTGHLFTAKELKERKTELDEQNLEKRIQSKL